MIRETKHLNKTGNGLADLPDCCYVIETYFDEYKQICQSIMFHYNDDMERQYQRSQVALLLHLGRRMYFKSNGIPIYREDFKNHGEDVKEGYTDGSGKLSQTSDNS